MTKLFNLGPVEMFPSTRDMGGRQPLYFRNAEFSEMMLDIDTMLKKAVGAPMECKTMYLTCSGTGAMEATIANCCSEEDKALIVNGGKFAGYFIQLCQIFRIPYETVDLAFNETLTKAHLIPFENKGFTVLMVNIHETSTGQLYDTALLADFCRRNRMYFLVDAISSIAADPFDMDKHGVDAAIMSSHKGFALSPGLSMVILSSRFFEERVLRLPVRSMYFDFKYCEENMRRGQTSFTPAINVIYQLHDMLQRLTAEGIESRVKKTHALAKCFRRLVEQLGLIIPSTPLSNAVTPIIFDDLSAHRIYDCLRHEYSLSANPNGLLPERLLMVGHLGCLEEKDMRLFASGLAGAITACREAT